MLTKTKYIIIFLIVFTLLPVQVRAEEKVEKSEENVGQIVNQNQGEVQKEKGADAKEEASLVNESALQEKKFSINRKKPLYYRLQGFFVFIVI